VVDTQGEKLKHALIHKPFLVKPNRSELERHCGRSLPELEDVVEEARRIQEAGVTYVCVSLGADGAVILGPDHCYRASSPDVPVRSTVGAGDSLVGGLVAGFSRGLDAMETLRLAICCGSGTVRKPGTQLFTREDLIKLEEQVEISELDL
jgi:6-phosphofructokinase 2